MLYNFDEPINRSGTDSVKYDQMAREYNDPAIIGMRIADSDYSPPKNFLKALKNRIEHRVMGYTEPSERVFSTVSDFFMRHAHWKFDASQIQFSPGIIPIVSANLLLHSNAGDEIVLFEPKYPVLAKCILAHGRKMLTVPLPYDAQTGQYSVDLDLFEKTLTPQTKILIFCNPHNPIGYVWTREELLRIAQICLERKIVVISDEINAFLNFPEFPYTPMASLSEEIAQNTISAFSPSKLFDIPGLMYSFSVIPNAEWSDLYLKSLEASGLIFVKRNFVGLLAIETCYQEQNDEWLAQKIAYIQNNAHMVDEYFEANLPDVLPTPSGGLFLKWLNFRFPLSHDEINRKLVQEAHVVLFDGREFTTSPEKFFRMNIGCTQLTLKTALGQIRKAFCDD